MELLVCWFRFLFLRWSAERQTQQRKKRSGSPFLPDLSLFCIEKKD
jgi:hypothetical protein